MNFFQTLLTDFWEFTYLYPNNLLSKVVFFEIRV